MRAALLLIFIIPLIIGSCKVHNHGFIEKKLAQEVTISNEFIEKNKASYTIDQASLVGDILSIYVTYSGGCKKHMWSLMGANSFDKTDPPKKTLYLKHNANGDYCRSMLTDTLFFNIEKTKYPNEDKNYTIILQLAEFKEEIPYRY